MTKLNLKALGFGCCMGIVLSMLIIEIDLSPVIVTGIIITVAMGMATWITFSMQGKTRKAIDAGDARTNYDVDISAEHRPLPESVVPTAFQLWRLGFRRLGEGALASAEGKELGVEWSYISADGRVIAGLVPSQMHWSGMFAGLTSIFPDETWCITMYPTGGSPLYNTITHPNFWFHHVYTSVEGAYQQHLGYMEKFARMHGEPRVFETMDEYHAMSPVFRQKGYNELMLRRPKLFSKLQVDVPGVLALIALLGTILGNFAPDVALMILMLCLSTYFVFVSWLLPIHPRVKRIFPLIVIGIAIVFVPLLLVSPWAAFLQAFTLAVLSMVLMRYVPAEAKAFAKAIQEGQTDVDWQGRGL